MLGRKDVKEFNAKLDSIIGADTVFEGNLKTGAVTRVDGTVKGDITAEGTLIVGPKGKITGNVSAKYIIVGGAVEGDLSATQRIEVSSSGRISGNIETKSLIVDENAKFQGQCVMNMDAGKKNDVKAETTAAKAE